MTEHAVIYARVSSKEQEKEGFSIPAQLDLLRKYASDNDFAVLSEFTDVETAKQSGRAQFSAMLAFIRKRPKCQTILVEKTDRLYRNLKDYLTLDEAGVQIHFVKENFILSPQSHSSQKFLHGIKVLMAKNYIDNLSEETKKGKLQRARDGVYPSNAPVGYLNITLADGRKIIGPDPQTAPIITRLFESYATGRFTLKEIAALAESLGLHFRSSQKIHYTTVHKIFNNRFYIGEFYYAGQYFKGIHEPLVSAELWQKVQRLMSSRHSNGSPNQKHGFPFAGLIHCGYCGCQLTGEIKKGRYIYYHCTGAKGSCDKPYVRQEILERMFVDAVRSLRIDGEVLDIIREGLRDSHRTIAEEHEKALNRLNAEYKRLQARLEQAYEDRLDGVIDLAYYERKRKDWQAEQNAVANRIKEHQTASRTYIEEGISLLELCREAGQLFEFQPPSEKRRLLDFVLSNSTYSREDLTVEFKQPFDWIRDMALHMNPQKANTPFEVALAEVRGNRTHRTYLSISPNDFEDRGMHQHTLTSVMIER